MYHFTIRCGFKFPVLVEFSKNLILFHEIIWPDFIVIFCGSSEFIIIRSGWPYYDVAACSLPHSALDGIFEYGGEPFSVSDSGFLIQHRRAFEQRESLGRRRCAAVDDHEVVGRERRIQQLLDPTGLHLRHCHLRHRCLLFWHLRGHRVPQEKASFVESRHHRQSAAVIRWYGNRHM